VLCAIIDDVEWCAIAICLCLSTTQLVLVRMNVHTLPHAVCVFEVRTSRGYGARWELGADESTVNFRGFVEPQIANGHDVGWVH
jgi:hypothetical protein